MNHRPAPAGLQRRVRHDDLRRHVELVRDTTCVWPDVLDERLRIAPQRLRRGRGVGGGHCHVAAPGYRRNALAAELPHHAGDGGEADRSRAEHGDTIAGSRLGLIDRMHADAERLGIEDEVLRLLDGTVEIPVYGLPYSHNAATATAMALYEYCRQFPSG